MHVNIDLQTLKADQKLLGGHGKKWVWSVWSHNSKIDCISKMNKFSKAKIWFNYCWVGMVKNSHNLIVHGTLNLLDVKNEFLDWAGFLNADSDAVIFG